MVDMDSVDNTAILVPIETEEFWRQIRLLIRQELSVLNNARPKAEKAVENAGLTYKPLYDMTEVRKLFDNVSRTTIYEWIRIGKLKPKKMKGKIYFLWTDISAKLNEL